MSYSQTFTTDLNCTVSDLAIKAIDPSSKWAFHVTEPVELSLKVTLSDNVDQHLVELLVSMGLKIWISFYARPHRPQAEIQLGDVWLETQANIFTYSPKLLLEAGLASVGLDPDQVYWIGAIARIGNSPLPVPSLIRGYVEGIRIPTPPITATDAIEPATESITPPIAESSQVSRPRRKSARTRSKKPV